MRERADPQEGVPRAVLLSEGSLAELDEESGAVGFHLLGPLEGATLVGLGLLIGTPGIYAVARLMRTALVGVSASDPLTLAAVALGLAAVTLTTCYLPARRVLRIEPAELLRGE